MCDVLNFVFIKFNLNMPTQTCGDFEIAQFTSNPTKYSSTIDYNI